MLLCCMARCRGAQDLVVFGWLRSLRDGVADLQCLSSSTVLLLGNIFFRPTRSSCWTVQRCLGRWVKSCCRTVEDKPAACCWINRHKQVQVSFGFFLK
jgi:hypothetical protein